MPNIPKSHLHDEELTGAVIRAVTHDGRVNAADIVHVSVVDGVALLSGAVRTAAQKHAAGQDAARVRGITGVDNKLTVATEGTISDAELQRQIDQRLAQAPNLIRKVGAEVEDGIATLVGWVTDAAERRQALAIARGVPGVDAVVSTLEIRAKRSPAAGFPIDDTTLIGKVAEALDTANLDIADRTIQVDQGEATLRGLVPTAAEATRAEQVTAAVDGIRAVHTHLDLLLSEESSDPDQALAARVLRALSSNHTVKIGTLQIVAHAGQISVSGAVGSIAGQNAITRLVRKVPGVKAVDNRTRLTDVTSAQSDDKGLPPPATFTAR